MIGQHPRFARMADAFLRAFGDVSDVTFSTSAGPVNARAVVRSASEMHEDAFPVAGVMAEEAFIAVAQADGARLHEGATFVHSGRTWRVSGPAERDGRAMARFPIEVVI